jgi:hypothetical protein
MGMTEREASHEEAHREEIRAAAVDYMQSWLDGDADRMRRCLHPDLAKRRVRDTATGDLALWEVPARDLIDDAMGGPKLQYAGDFEITILDADDEVASVRILSQPFNEYLHLARFGDRWLVVNALYRRRAN